MPSIAHLLTLLAAVSTLSFATKHGDDHHHDHEHHAALIITDVQDCFLPHGSLAVKHSEEVIPVINRIRYDYGDKFDLVVLTQDYHCSKHVSFASSHRGKKVGDVVDLDYTRDGKLCQGGTITTQNFPDAHRCSHENGVKTIQQILWPDHCVQHVTSGSESASISSKLHRESTDVIIEKGTQCEIDSYSAFYDNGHFAHSDLHKILQSHGIDTVFVAGISLDFCVFFTAKDAKILGYNTYTIIDASRGVYKESTYKALKTMEAEGIHLIQSDELGPISEKSSAPRIFGPSVFLLVVSLLLAL